MTLWYTAGISAAAGMALSPIVTIILLTITGAGLMLTSHDWAARQLAWPFGVCLALAGGVLGTLALHDRKQDCRIRLVDQRAVTAVGALQPATARRAGLQLQAIEGNTCSERILML